MALTFWSETRKRSSDLHRSDATFGIMVTMPSEAATHYELVRDLLANGMELPYAHQLQRTTDRKPGPK